MRNKKLLPRILIGVLGCALLLAGLSNDGYRDTLQKASRICMECIGIG
ncbi:hypothetical protein LJC07_03435 [Christensenellaceae bacterium OttesenSCG-928-L17]|nr:hypothetical protein [Christensenellaceae bacterium OttesenSCG-928-L17]